MRYVAFPSYFFDEKTPRLDAYITSSIKIISGPTTSGLYIVEASKEAIELLKSMTESYYIIMEDFDDPVIN